MIELQQVSKAYDNAVAVKSISFTIKEGETLVLLGTSGCGKTTTLRMINRLINPTSGKVFFEGKDIATEPAEKLRRKMGYVLQHTGLFPHYTIEENIATVPHLLGWPKDKIYRRVDELLEKLKLVPGQYRHLYPHQLSGGQQQRVGLARALAANPPVLLMDEPFGALDPVTRSKIKQEFLELDELKAKTVVLVTHDVQEAFELGDRICLMDKGEIVQLGTPAELLFKPVNDFVSSFLQDQHLLLELQAITLHDVWDELHDTAKTFAEHEVNISASLWSVLQQMNAIPNTSGNFFASQNGVQKTLHTATIMQAYHLYKMHQAHE